MTLRYHIADEEGYIYAVSDDLVKTAIKFFTKNHQVEYLAVPSEYSKEITEYLGEKLDSWKSLPMLTAGSSFRKIGHVLTRG